METIVNYSYQLLVTDTTGRSEITTEKSMVLALSYSEKLWKNPVPSTSHENSVVQDETLGIALSVKKVSEPGTVRTSFILSFEASEFKNADDFRVVLLTHLKSKLGFSNISVLRDDVSAKISRDIYYKISYVENALRTSLAQAFFKEKGISWWTHTASKELIETINKRKNIDNSVTSIIDGEIMFTDTEELYQLALPVFPDHNFQVKWGQLTKVKNSLIHNHLFVIEDFILAESISREILDIIQHPKTTATKVTTPLVSYRKAAEEIASRQESRMPVEQPIEGSSFGSGKEFEKIRKDPSPYIEEPVATINPPYDVTGNILQMHVSKIVEEKPTETSFEKLPETENIPTSPSVAVSSINENTAQAAKKEEVVAEVPKNEGAASKSSDTSFKMITEKDLISELKSFENSKSGFVDLKLFATEILGPKGYPPGSVYSLARTMNDKGTLKIYEVKDNKGFNIRAIKTV